MPFLVIQGYQNQKFSFPQPPVYSSTSKRYLLIYSGFSSGMYFLFISRPQFHVFSRVFSVYPPWGWSVLEAERLLRSWHHIRWRNTKIWIHRASRMKWKRGKCWKLPIFESKLRVIFSYLSEMKTVCSITLPYSTTCFYHFLLWIYLNSSMTGFSSGILLPFPNSNDLNSLLL